MNPHPTLIACSHGTADPAGKAAIHSIINDIRATRPELDVREAFVDVEQPEVAHVVDRALADGATAAVVVPLLLSPGFHTHVDIADAVNKPRASATPTLGPHPLLLEILLDRLNSAGATTDDTIVLAAAGSSDPRAGAVVEQVRHQLEQVWGTPITVGYGAVAEPAIADAVRTARETRPGARVVIAAHLLAPGFFHNRVKNAGADLVTEPLAPDPRLTTIVLNRFDEATEPVGESTP